MRRVIAERLLASKTQLPHFYLFHRGRCEVLSCLRKELNSANESAGLPKLTVNDF
jgi:pyruvate dehydrogenase E2 component (dihydrolipoamide acetyltransferase)